MKPRLRRFWIGTAAAVAFLLVWVNLSIRSTQTAYEVRRVEERIRAEQKRRLELEMERDAALSLESLQETARKRYGLAAPREENLVILDGSRP